MTLEHDFHKFLEITGGDATAAAVLAHAATMERLAGIKDVAPKPLSVADVAAELQVSPATVRGWIRSGQLRAANLTSGPRPRHVIAPEDLDAFLQSRQGASTTQPKRKCRLNTLSTRF